MEAPVPWIYDGESRSKWLGLVGYRRPSIEDRAEAVVRPLYRSPTPYRLAMQVSALSGDATQTMQAPPKERF
jgi:hypothetical protein